MTKEQEEAIEILKRIDIRFFLSGMNEQSNYIVDEADKVNKAIETVLNLLEKKDKIIDLMAKSLIGVIFSDENNVEIIFENKEELKQYFENQVKM